MHFLRNALASLILIAVITGTIYIFMLWHSPQVPKKTQKLEISNITLQKVAEAKEVDRTVTSSDGTKALTMKEKDISGNEAVYSFYALESKTPFYTETLNKNEYSMGLPDNAWSPGEKYLFLEKIGGGVKTDLLFMADGSAFADKKQFIDVGQLFSEKYPGYIYTGATGWAASDLLIVESSDQNGNVGPSFWFELPQGNFIQLAQRQ